MQTEVGTNFISAIGGCAMNLGAGLLEERQSVRI